MKKLWIKGYRFNKFNPVEHIEENISLYREYTLFENPIKEWEIEHWGVILTQKNDIYDDTANGRVLQDIGRNNLMISWHPLQDTIDNIVLENTRDGGTEIDVVDEDGNIID